MKVLNSPETAKVLYDSTLYISEMNLKVNHWHYIRLFFVFPGWIFPLH